MKYFSFLVMVLLSPIIFSSDELPGDSVYQIEGEWQSQDSDYMELPDLVGKKQIVTMIYTHCEHVCPVIVSSMKSVESDLPDKELQDTGFVLITFTPNSDTPEVMKAFADQRGLDLNRWTLLRGSSEQIRTLAMALGVKYELLGNNEVNHSNLISVLDEQGRMVFQGSGALAEAGTITDYIVSN